MVKGLAEILLAYRAIFIALLDGFGELDWVGIGLIIFKTWSWSPCKLVFVSSKSGDTVLLRVSNCSISFIGSSAKLINFSIATWYKINLSLDLSLWSSSSRLIVLRVSSSTSFSR